MSHSAASARAHQPVGRSSLRSIVIDESAASTCIAACGIGANMKLATDNRVEEFTELSLRARATLLVSRQLHADSNGGASMILRAQLLIQQPLIRLRWCVIATVVLS